MKDNISHVLSDIKTVDKITKIKYVFLLLYVVNLFLPIYKQRFLGDVARTSIANLNAGLFFVSFFVVLSLAVIITKLIDEKIHTITYLSSTSLMLIFLFIIAFFKENTSILGIAFYIQIILIIAFILIYIQPNIVIKISDYIVEFIINCSKFIYRKTKELYQKVVVKMNEKRESKTEYNRQEDKEEMTDTHSTESNKERSQ
jgi:hypothetical protein